MFGARLIRVKIGSRSVPVDLVIDEKMKTELASPKGGTVYGENKPGKMRPALSFSLAAVTGFAGILTALSLSMYHNIETKDAEKASKDMGSFVEKVEKGGDPLRPEERRVLADLNQIIAKNRAPAPK